MAGHVITVPQQDGEIVVTFPGLRRVPLAVVDGRVTVHDDQVAAAVLTSVDGARELDEPAADFDPDQHTVAEVNAHLDKHPEQAPAVLAAERDGRARTGILTGPHAPDPMSDDEPAGDTADQPD
jgi:hypothetical protein